MELSKSHRGEENLSQIQYPSEVGCGPAAIPLIAKYSQQKLGFISAFAIAKLPNNPV